MAGFCCQGHCFWRSVRWARSRVWGRCAKRRHQEAMIYLAFERELITKAEIDTMLKQVDELTVVACPSLQNGKGNGNSSTAKTSEG